MKQWIGAVFCICLVAYFSPVFGQGQANAEAGSRAGALLSQMSLRQKLNEMHGRKLLRYGLSIVFGKRVKPVHAGGNKKLGIPPTIFFDGPRGLASYKGATVFPTTMVRGASWDIELEYRIGEAMGKEVRAAGGNYSGSVCVNLLRHPAWGRAQETYGEDPHLLGELGWALSAGIQKHKVQACAKHFAANSMENNRCGGSMNMDEITLREVYLPHFRKLALRGIASFMSAYNKLNGTYCGEHRHLLTEILREEWGFEGYVTSDWVWGLKNAEAGIKAGMNIEMPVNTVYNNRQIKKLLKNGNITMAHIDSLVFPVLYTKFAFLSGAESQTYPKEILGNAEHTLLAREAAEKGSVLLKNENQVLPLNKTEIKEIVLLGSLVHSEQTGDRGSSKMNAAYVISPSEGIISYLNGTGIKIYQPAATDTASIRKYCTNADAVIVVAGTTYLDEGEYIGNGTIRDPDNPNKKTFPTRNGVVGLGGDRKHLNLHEADVQTIKQASLYNNKVIVGLVAGAAIMVEEWHNEVEAILHLGYNGQEGGNALARILFGDVNPSGKLPFTVPKAENDLPPFNSFDAQVEYGYFHGYTLFDKENKEPRYPYGFGLSYTSFNYSGLQLNLDTDSIYVRFEIENTGSKPGAEVMQVYAGYQEAASIGRPVKRLLGFKKIMLQPGKKQWASISIGIRDLWIFNPQYNTWEMPWGMYKIWLGNSSRDENALSADINLSPKAEQ